MGEIDAARLPKSALLDTTVLIRALGDRPNDPQAPLCRELFETMIANKLDVLIAAPTLAEIYRGGGSGKPPPQLAQFCIVSFDDEAARILGTRFPQLSLVNFQKSTGDPLSYYKYDALIVACAVRHRADVLVSLDSQMRTLATSVQLRAVAPDEYRYKQGSLDL